MSQEICHSNETVLTTKNTFEPVSITDSGKEGREMKGGRAPDLGFVVFRVGKQSLLSFLNQGPRFVITNKLFFNLCSEPNHFKPKLNAGMKRRQMEQQFQRSKDLGSSSNV